MVGPENVLLIEPGFMFQGRYRVVRQIRVGGMGAVYEVFDELVCGPRALKTMLPHLAQDPVLRSRFTQEATIVGAIESEHLVRVSDVGIEKKTGSPFLVMDLLRGQDFQRLIKRNGPFSAQEVTTFLQQVALALDRTHAAHVVHRDLKPANLFLTYRDDGSPCVKVLDFGAATTMHEQERDNTTTIGTPLYMAPEQAFGHRSVGPWSDIYALGHVAFTLLVGKPYWCREAARETPLSRMARVSEGDMEPPSARSARLGGPALTRAFDLWFFKATDPEPGARFQSTSQAVEALVDALRPNGEPASQTGHVPISESTKSDGWVWHTPTRSRRSTQIGGFLSGLALVALVGALSIPRLRATPSAAVAHGRPNPPPTEASTSIAKESVLAPSSAPMPSSADVSPTLPVEMSAPPIPRAPTRARPVPSSSSQTASAVEAAASVPQPHVVEYEPLD